MDYLEVLLEQNASARVRRVRHLLGVCASFQGHWDRAIPSFVSALSAPIKDLSEIDEGDCVAAYWLGDTYSLLGKRTEALLAYSIAERGSIFNQAYEPDLKDLIAFEQKAVQSFESRSNFKIRWHREAINGTPPADSILNPHVLSKDVVKILLENEPKSFSSASASQFRADKFRTRSNLFYWLSKNGKVGQYHNLKICTEHFETDHSWPMRYDPMFTMANVAKGRIRTYECDLVSEFASNEHAKVPKSMALSRVDCFTSTDLTWLITTIRACLKTNGMESREFATIEETGFVVWYPTVSRKIATTYHFSIAIFKQSFRAGYGVEVCPDGIYSARTISTYPKGVDYTEPKRIKKLIREYLDEAAKEMPRLRRKSSAGESAPQQDAEKPH